MKVGIKLKLVSFITLLLFIVICILSFIVLKGIKNYQKTENETILINQKNMFEQYLADKFSAYNNNESNDFQLVSSDIFNKPWLTSIPASLYNIKGNLLSGINNSNTYSIEDGAKMITFAGNDKIAYKNIGDTLLFYSPLKYKDKTVAILRLEYSIKSNNEFYENIKHLFIISGFFVLISGIVMGSIYMMSFTGAIQKMKVTVINIQNGFFSQVEVLDRNDELGDLSQGIKYMSDTIEKNIIELEKEKDSLKKAVDKLKEYDLQQREFINNVTHEFKTPLTSIKAYADVMSMYDYDPKLIEDASYNISSECERLKTMIDNILELSKIERYDFGFNKATVELKPLFEEICLRMMGKIKKNDLSLESNISNEIIVSDEESLRYIFINILDNAIKYNKPGGKVLVNLYRNDMEVILEVLDTGLGIPDNAIDKIFEPFYRASNDRSRTSGGTGLGLAFVKKLVEKLNGRIAVKSEINKGSKFVIRFLSNNSPEFAKM